MNYWQPSDLRYWYQQSGILVHGDGGNGKLIPKGHEILVATRKIGSVTDIVLSDKIAFAALEGSQIISGRGLQYFIETELSIADTKTAQLIQVPTAVFDNHNHALFFWARALEQGITREGATLVHIDMHSDLWDNEHTIDPTKLRDLLYMGSFTNLACNVGNYIIPAQKAGLISEMIRIEGEEQLKTARAYLEKSIDRLDDKNIILNLDLDIFAPELDDISFELKREVILGYAAKAQYITIATSPFFIDEKRALEYLGRVFF